MNKIKTLLSFSYCPQLKILFVLMPFMSQLFISCKKDNMPASEKEIISVDTNGVKTAFNYRIKATLFRYSGSHEKLTVLGYGDSDIILHPIPNIIFNVEDSNKITTKSYVISNSIYPLVGLAYIFYVSPNYSVSTAPALNTTNPLTITITEMTSTTMKGTFSGEVLYFIGSKIYKLVLSNGSFTVNYTVQ